MKLATINIRSVKLHNPEPTSNATDGNGGERGASATTTTARYRTVTYPVYVQVFKSPVPDPLNDEALRVVVAQKMAETPDRPLSPSTDTGGLVVGAVIAHVMDASTVEINPPPPLPRLLPIPQNLPVPLPPPPLTPTLAPHNLLSQRCYPQ